MGELRQEIISLLNRVQDGLQHKKLLQSFSALFEKTSNSKVFFETFFVIFSNTLLVFKREPAAERLIDFVSKFAFSCLSPRNEEEGYSSSSDDEDDDNFTQLLVAKLTSIHEAKEKAVRFRVCQLLAKLTTAIADNGTRHLPLSTLDRIVDAMSIRIHDKVPVTRAQAVQILAKVYDPEQSDSPIINSLLWTMESDPSPDVRKAAVMNIAITSTTLPVLIGRTRDINKSVRRATFLILSEKCSIKYFSIKQRLNLLQCGLKDRCSATKEACVRGLLRSWCMECEGDFLQLLYRLDVESSPEISELALMSLFDQLTDEELLTSMELAMNPNSEENEDGKEKENMESDRGGFDSASLHIIPFDQLNSSLVFYWRCLCKYFHTREEDSTAQLERITPTLSQFCDYMQRFSDEVLESSDNTKEQSVENEFTGRQLLSLLPYLDMDEVGKHRFAQLFHSLAVSSFTPPSLISPMLALQRVVWPQESFRVEKLIETIADIRHPGLLEGTASQSGFTSLSYLELQEDDISLMKCLAVAGEMLKELDNRSLNPTLITLVESLLIPCFQNENPKVRDLAVWSLGLACLLDIDLARKHILLLVQVTQIDHENVQATAAKVIFDLFHLYGLEAFRPQIHSEGEGVQQGDKQLHQSAVALSQLVPGESRVTNNEEKETDTANEDMEIANVEETETANEDMEIANVESNEAETEHEKTDSGEKSDDPDEATQQILHLLAGYLDKESVVLRGVMAEGLSKLLLSGRVISHRLLVRLLLLWYNPILQEEDELREVLGTFFTVYSATDRSHRASIAELYQPAIETVLEAPSTSPIADIDVANMADFIINLSSPLRLNEVSAHDSLSFELANHLLSTDNHLTVVRMHCRSLSLMKLSPTNKTNAGDLLNVIQELTESLSDQISLRYLQKLVTVLRNIVPIPTGQPRAVSPGAVVNSMVAASPADSAMTKSRSASPDENRMSTTTSPSMASSSNTRPKKKRGRKGTTSKRDRVESTKENVPHIMPASSVRRSKAGKQSGDDSDDSLVGDHSPFVRSTRRMISPVPINYNID